MTRRNLFTRAMSKRNLIDNPLLESTIRPTGPKPVVLAVEAGPAIRASVKQRKEPT